MQRRKLRSLRATFVAGAIGLGVLGMMHAFAAVEGTVSFDTLRYRLTDIPVLTVTDADLNTNAATKQTATVTLSSTSDPAGISISLRETGVDTGVFNDPTESIEFSTIASSDFLNTLKVAAGDTLTMRYVDGAPSGTRSATATMFADTGTVAFDDQRYGVGDTATITVTDIDGNGDASVAETVEVTLTSPEDGTGITVTLTETSVNASTFTGTATFEDDGGSSTGTSLEIDPAATIAATYAEQLFDGSGTEDRTDTALMQVDGSASLNAIRYDFNDTATLTVTDDDLNTDGGSTQTVNVNFASDADATGITVTLTETGNDTGAFTGAATFTTGASAGSVLKAAQGDTVTLTYAETTTESGVPANRTDTAVMFADGATVALDKATYPTNATVTVTVTDADRNTDAGTTQSFNVSATSTSDPLGITFPATETGADTGVFEGTFTFSTLLSNDMADELLVAQGGTITVTYAEPNASGTGTTNRTATALIWTANNAVPALDQLRYPTNATPALSVTHPDDNRDRALAETIGVTLFSSTDATGITVALTESGPDTGVFNVPDVAVGFTTAGSSDDGTNTLRVADGDTITLRYAEPNAGGGGGTANRNTTGTIFADSATASLDASSYAADDTATLTVTDIDRNTDTSSPQTLTATLTSTTDATGVTVTLTETGNNTSTFTGTAAFTAAGPSNGSVLHAGSGDIVTLTYGEPEADGSGTTARTDTAAMFVDGEASLDRLRYQVNQTATLTVTDADLNTNPASLQTVDVTLDDVTDLLAGISVELTETGNDTGVFTGTATFTTGSTNDTNDVLHIAAGDTIRLSYSETTTFAGPGATRTADATMFINSATVAFDADRYGTGDTAGLTVTDIDANTDTGVAETVEVTVTSPEDGTGVTVTLTETSTDASTFAGTVTFENDGGASTGTSLEVDPGATITATYVEALLNGTGTANRTDTARMHVDGSASLNAIRYDFNDTATLTVTDADLNTASGTQQTVTVSFSSETDPAGISVTLTETGNNTGVFSGSATFATTPSVGTILGASQGDTVTLTYEETTTAGGVDADRTDTAVMFADSATAGFTSKAYALADEATVHVTDVDRNLDPEAAESFSTTVTSTVDGTGVTVTLTETGDDTGVFTGTATFTTDASSGTTLQVSEGNTITATYAEPNASGVGTTNRQGTASMFQDTATVALDAGGYGATDDPAITVTDADRNLDASVAETFDVTLSSSSDATGIAVTLIETGNDTGVFTGAGSLTTGASTLTDLSVSEGDLITATYDEPLFAGGTSARTDVAEIHINGTASLDASSYTLGDTATSTVTDPDLNAAPGVIETVDVNLASDTDPTGITVTLTETGANTGSFTGAATFTTDPSSGTVLQVGSGDVVTLTYAETTTFEGPAADRTDTATMATNGTAALDASSYALDDTATITVTDPDVNTAPGSAQTVDVEVASDTDPGTIIVTLTETGDDTGIFTGAATFTTAASSGTTLQVSEGDGITLTYAEATTFEGPAADRTDAATMTTNGSASLNAETYVLTNTATLTVTDPDLNTSAGSPQSVEVNLASGTDATGVTVTLTETGDDTGIFTGNATFTTDASSGTTLQVSGGDTITLTYAETTTFEGPNADRTDTATFTQNGTITLDQSRYDLDDGAILTVSDADLNADAGAVETVDVNLAGDTDATGVTVTLTETGNNTSTFTGAATFTTGASSGTTLQVSQGDTVTGTYTETSTFGGAPIDRTDTAVMATNGTAALDTSGYALDDTATLTVTDPDLNTAPGSAQTVDVEVASDTDPGTITVTLTETGDDTGVFTGAATFTTAASSGTTLQVSEGDEITLSYAETTTFEGPAADRTDTATMATNGTAALDASSYALDDTATITVTDPDLNTAPGSAQTVDVEVESDTDATGVDVTLTETGDDTGVFTGAATFTTDASSGTTLQVSEGDGITLTYAETTTFEGPTADRTDTASFPVNGSVAFDASTYALDETAMLTLTDGDQNADPAIAETIDVQVTSDTDITGVTVTLTETGDDTGIFAGSATFTTAASSGTTLQVAEGDGITVTYAEATTFEGPAADRTDAATMTTNATAALDATTYQLDDTATLTVADPDLNTSAGSPQSVEVNLASGTDTTGVSVALTETGDDTGIFTGNATFTTDASSGTTLQVSGGDTITLTYAEATTFEGPNTDRTDTAAFTQNGTITLDQSRYDLDDDATLTVSDADLNADAEAVETVDVNLAGDTDALGVTVTLTETGANTGTFTGAATFTTDASSGTTLQVSQGDTVTGTYTETSTFGGAPIDRTDTAAMATNGTAALDTSGYALDDTATLTVTDPDLNTSAESAQTVDVEVASDTDPGTITVTLTETGDDTGVFTGNATFTTDASSGTTLQVSEGDGITLTYAETTTFEGPAADRTDTATMLADLATATFGEDSYRTSDRPAVTVTDDDANLDPDAIDTVNVTVTSETDTTGISVELEESGVDTGVFDEPDEVIDLVTSGSSNDATNVLRVGGGDTITATYSEPSFSGGIALRDDSATVELAGQTFEDVSPTHPFFNFIETLVAEGITAGCSTSPPKYCPSSSVTRGQMAVFLIRAMGEEGNLEPYEGTFSDVPITHSFALYIEHLARLEITGGCGGGKYCPSSSVTRGQMAVFLVKAFEL